MKTTTIGTYQDNLLGVNYDLVMVNSAKELADNLKEVLQKNDVDYTKYNSHDTSRFDKDTAIEAPPIEIYEYQNFFVLEKNNGDLVLLDGFRRLLWYATPSTPILVKFYKEKDLSSQQILTLLVNLNHFKFFSNQNYHERGFSLLLKTVFNIDITTFRSTFDAYLSSSETKNSYSSYGRLTGQYKNEEIKNRIIGNHFVSDIRFLEKLKATQYLCDQYMGALLYEERLKSNTDFDINKFIELANNHTVLQELTVKYKKVGTDHSAKSQDVVNKIIEIYRNLFILMAGGEATKSFAEQQKECKDLVDKLKKDKTLIKLTGNTNIREIERIMADKINNGEKLEFVCVIHPAQPRESWRRKPENDISIPYGLFDGIQFLNFTTKHLDWMGNKDMNFGVIIDGYTCRVRHNSSDAYGKSGKKYTSLDTPLDCPNYEIDLFIRLDIPQEPKVKKPKELKKFTYTPQGRREKIEYFILAWTQKEAIELFNAVGIHMTLNEMREFVGKVWGIDGETHLKDVDQTQSAVYAVELNEGSYTINTNIAPKKLK